MSPARRRPGWALAFVPVALLALTLVVSLFFAVGSVSGSSVTPKATTGSYEVTWHGTAKNKVGRIPDVLVVPSPATGVWWVFTSVQISVSAPHATAWIQHDYLYTRLMVASDSSQTIRGQNFDFVAAARVKQGQSGTFVGGGGVGKTPNPSWQWIQWKQPISLNSELQVVLGSTLGVGNTATISIDYTIYSGTAVVKFLYTDLHGTALHFVVGPPSAGESYFIENALAEIKAGSGSPQRAAWIERTSGGYVLAGGNDFPAHTDDRDTGGYSTSQTGPSLTPYGSAVVWDSQEWLNGTATISVTLDGGSADWGEYVIVFTEVTTSG